MNKQPNTTMENDILNRKKNKKTYINTTNDDKKKQTTNDNFVNGKLESTVYIVMS